MGVKTNKYHRNPNNRNMLKPMEKNMKKFKTQNVNKTLKMENVCPENMLLLIIMRSVLRS